MATRQLGPCLPPFPGLSSKVGLVFLAIGALEPTVAPPSSVTDHDECVAKCQLAPHSGFQVGCPRSVDAGPGLLGGGHSGHSGHLSFVGSIILPALACWCSDAVLGCSCCRDDVSTGRTWKEPGMFQASLPSRGSNVTQKATRARRTRGATIFTIRLFYLCIHAVCNSSTKPVHRQSRSLWAPVQTRFGIFRPQAV